MYMTLFTTRTLTHRQMNGTAHSDKKAHTIYYIEKHTVTEGHVGLCSYLLDLVLGEVHQPVLRKLARRLMINGVTIKP